MSSTPEDEGNQTTQGLDFGLIQKEGYDILLIDSEGYRSSEKI